MVELNGYKKRWRGGQARNRRASSRLTRALGVCTALVLALGGVASVEVAIPPTEAHAIDSDSPMIYKVQSFWDRIDGDVDEIRADVVIRVPHGYVDPDSGQLQTVNGKQLHVGHDYNTGSGRKSHRYLNTISGGANGAAAWAANRDEYFTIHKVLPSGRYDFLVMSIEGDIDILNAPAETNVVGGLESVLNFYFSYETGAPSTSTGWTSSALTTEPMTFYWYYGARVSSAITGPQYRIPWDNIQSLWSAGQANWGAVLDYGLNGYAPGVLPPNSLGLDLVNNATRNGNPEAGPTGTITESMWYAWVHEDGSLVESINTGPIRLTGNSSRDSRSSTERYIIKNLAQSARPDAPALGWTIEQAEQGLTQRVGIDGSIDFSDAGGNGYYRLLAWPEARDPLAPNASHGAPTISYTAADLFDANGYLTPRADKEKWTPGSVYYRYDIPLPDAPVITEPPHNSHTNVPDSVTISGTGTPGHTISLKFTAGTGITEYNDPSLTLLVDGDHAGVGAGDVVVAADGTWTFTYTPAEPLADGVYTVVAVQTDQEPGNFHLSSPMSNPDDPEAATVWGVTFTVDTIAPDAPMFVCPATPTEDTTPTFTGSGIEAGARVFVSQDGERIGEATVTGNDWTYTVDPPLTNGSYTFTVTQTDQAGNESVVSSPSCELRVATAVDATGVKVVVPVVNSAPGLTEVSADNWEITLSDGSETVVMGGENAVQLDRDTTYTVAERLRAAPAPDDNANRYAQLGTLACVDADGGALPSGVLDPEAGTLLVGSEIDLAEPIACTISNQAAQASFVTLRLGGQTEAPSSGWTLGLASTQGGLTTALDEQTPSAIIPPGEADLAAAVPDGLSLVGVQMLDLSRPECLAQVADPTSAAADCWIQLGEDSAAGVTVPQGQHSVYRLVAAAPADLPKLPITGGLGSWIFTAGGAAVLAVAGGVYLRRRYLLALPTSDDGRSD